MNDSSAGGSLSKLFSGEDHRDGRAGDGRLEVDAETAWLGRNLRLQRGHVEEQRSIRG